MKTDNQHNVKEGQQIGSKIKRSNIVNEFFWICSGANRHILRQCPTEYSKYFGIGGTIFFTAAMAALSGGYAFYTIFNEEQSSEFMQILSNPALYLAIAFGIFWGLLIFNLDRFIVNTMYSDGKHTISWKELGLGSPRIVIAIFLGIVISTPIEMRIFNDEIEKELDRMQRNEIIKAHDENQQLHSDIKEKELNIERIIGMQRENEADLTELENKLYAETNGTGVTGKIGYGPAAKQLQETVDRKRNSVERDNELLNQEIERIRKELAGLYKQRDEAEKATAIATSKLIGFTARMEAMYNITAWKKKAQRLAGEKNTLFWVRIIIMLLFIIIEIAPTIFKMMIASGPYDELLKEEMERKKAQSITNVSRINDDANTQIQIVVEKNKDKLAAEVAANKEILAKIASVQAELLETAIEEWRKEELAKIKADPSQYIKSNTKKS